MASCSAAPPSPSARQKSFRQAYNFFPRTWLLPMDRSHIMDYYKGCVTQRKLAEEARASAAAATARARRQAKADGSSTARSRKSQASTGGDADGGAGGSGGSGSGGGGGGGGGDARWASKTGGFRKPAPSPRDRLSDEVRQSTATLPPLRSAPSPSAAESAGRRLGVPTKASSFGSLKNPPGSGSAAAESSLAHKKTKSFSAAPSGHVAALKRARARGKKRDAPKKKPKLYLPPVFIVKPDASCQGRGEAAPRERAALAAYVHAANSQQPPRFPAQASG